MKSSQTETEILNHIRKHDPNDEYNIVKLRSTFEYRENYAMVFEKLGMSLYDFLKKNNYIG